MPAFESVVRLLSTMRPIAPWHWREASRRLASADGWTPPMMIIAALGSGIGTHGLCELLLGPRLELPVLCATWVTWFIVGLIATCAVARRGVAHLLRYGLWGFTRPRWWFELSRLAGLFTLLDGLLLGLAATALLQGLRGPMVETATLAYYVLCAAAGAWFVAATTGYVLAWVLLLPLRGKAFECVHYFYTIILTVTLAAIGVTLWDSNASLFQRAVAIACGIGTVGTILLFSIIKRAERSERNAAARGQQGSCGSVDSSGQPQVD